MKTDEFVTMTVSWPWPWIGSRGIPPCGTHRPYLLTTFHGTRTTHKNIWWTDGRTYGHIYKQQMGFVRSTQFVKST